MVKDSENTGDLERTENNQNHKHCSKQFNFILNYP